MYFFFYTSNTWSSSFWFFAYSMKQWNWFSWLNFILIKHRLIIFAVFTKTVCSIFCLKISFDIFVVPHESFYWSGIVWWLYSECFFLFDISYNKGYNITDFIDDRIFYEFSVKIYHGLSFSSNFKFIYI